MANIQLPDELASKLQAAAETCNLTSDELLEQILLTHLDPPPAYTEAQIDVFATVSINFDEAKS